MTKARKQITIDPRLAEKVDARDEFNLSAFVNESLKYFFDSDEMGEVGAVQAQIERLNDEIEETADDLDEKRDLRDDLEEQLEEKCAKREREIEEVCEKLEGASLDPDNPGIQHQASGLGIPPEELVESLKEHRAGEGDGIQQARADGGGNRDQRGDQ